MDKINEITITSSEAPTLMITNRGFYRAPYSRELDPIFIQTYGYEKLKYPLGFTDNDLKLWKENNCTLLEVGPGQGTSFLWLKQNGFDIYTIEPALRLQNDELADKAHKNLDKYAEEGRVSSANAIDAHIAFGEKFDVAFAIGPNFSTYSESKEAFYAQVSGLIASLKKKRGSFLTFMVTGKEAQVEINRGYGKPVSLAKELKGIGVKFDIVQADSNDHAIRIYRFNDDNVDASTVIPQLIKSHAEANQK